MTNVPSFMEEEMAETVPVDAVVETPAEVEQVEAVGENETVAPPATTEPEHRNVPITALLDEREKRQRAEREAEELRKEKARLEASRTQAPDFYDDPEARLQAERQMAAQVAWNNKLDVSEMLAREKHGEETVEAAKAAFIGAVQNKPELYAELMRQQNPYAYVVSWHKRNSIMSQMGDDPDAWIEQQVSARMQAARPVQPKPPAPPPSVSSANPSGGSKPAIVSGFEQLFGD